MRKHYRDRIYARYATLMQDAHQVFDEAAAKRWGKAYDFFLRGWLPDNKDASIIEVGCGRGVLLYFFKANGYKNIRGVDISPEQVRLARQVTDSVSEEDATGYLQCHPDTFDLIIGLDIIEHFKKDEVFDFLDACYTALRPGGRLILQTPNAESPWGGMHRYHDFTHEVCFDPQSLKKLLELFRFDRIECRETGPVVHGIVSLSRFLVWKFIRFLLLAWNLAEAGHKGSGIYTRTFLMSGVKGNSAP